ncbi:MAG TPA: single-stranded DNA-binding protein [Thermoanaerobaculia bacterium]|jgi:single-stranded DNA-binding protein|nr:single-stranded DNA-binding protein [Thermoanaerobaculia bacterium]
MTRPLILTGYLGKDPEIRQTQVRTIQGKRRNRVAQLYDRYEFTTRPRDFIVLSLATHDEHGVTTWHRLVAWNGDQLCYRNLRFAGKGDRIKVEVRPEAFRYTDDEGKERTLRQLIVLRFRVLKRKHIPPEIP